MSSDRDHQQPAYVGEPAAADDAKDGDGINEDLLDENLGDFICEAAGHPQPSPEDYSFPPLPEELLVSPKACITSPTILVQNGEAWLEAEGEAEGRDTYPRVLMRHFRQKGIVENGTPKFVAGVLGFVLSATVIGLPYVRRSTHIVEQNTFGCASTKSGHVKVYPPGFRANYSMNRTKFEKRDYDQDYVNYNDALHVLRVRPGEVAVISVAGSDMLLGPGKNGETGYHVFVSPNVEVKQPQTAANELRHLKCGLWHMVHVKKGRVQHVTVDGVDYALFHRPGGHWFAHKKVVIGDEYDTTQAFRADTLYRIIVPSDSVAGLDVGGYTRLVTKACSAWLSTEKPVTIAQPKKYNGLTKYECKNLTLLRLSETEVAVISSRGNKFVLGHGVHVLRLPAILVAIVNVAPVDFRSVKQRVYDKNNTVVDIKWQGRWRVADPDAYTRWSEDPRVAEAFVGDILNDLVVAMGRCVALTDLYGAPDEVSAADTRAPAGQQTSAPMDRVRRLCAARTGVVVAEQTARLAKHGVSLSDVWISAVVPSDPATLAEYQSVAQQRARDFATRRAEEQERAMKEVRVAAAERVEEEKRLKLARDAEAAKRADDIRRSQEKHIRDNETAMLDDKLALDSHKARNAATLALTEAQQEEQRKMAMSVAAAERAAKVALVQQQAEAALRLETQTKAAELERAKAEADANLRRLMVENEAAVKQAEADAEAKLKQHQVRTEAERMALETEARLKLERDRVQAEAERRRLEAEAEAKVAEVARSVREAEFELEQAQRERKMRMDEAEQKIRHAAQMFVAEFERAMAEACPRREEAKVIAAIGESLQLSGVSVTGNMSADQLADMLGKMYGLPVDLQKVVRSEALGDVIGGMRAFTSVQVPPTGGERAVPTQDRE